MLGAHLDLPVAYGLGSGGVSGQYREQLERPLSLEIA
jgi:hypothetical protein